MDIHYTIQFYSYWHCGSGLAAGADVDELVIKDYDRFPFVPGKTMKGLIRDAVEEIISLRDQWNQKRNYFIQTFGNSEDKDHLAQGNEEHKSQQGEAFFTNAEFPEVMKKKIQEGQLQEYLYVQLASTAIDKDGIAKDHSLRQTEAVIPCTMEGKILHVPTEFSNDILNGMKFIKRLGMNRFHGLGRCDIKGKEVQK